MSERLKTCVVCGATGLVRTHWNRFKVAVCSARCARARKSMLQRIRRLSEAHSAAGVLL